VSVNYEGTGPGNDPDPQEFGTAANISVSANGRYVAYESEATDLVPGVTNNNYTTNVYVRDLQTNTTILVSRDVAGTNIGDGPSNHPVISADGSTVAFDSLANNLDPNYTGPAPFSNYQVYVSTLGPNDTVSTTKLVSIDPTGTTAGNDTSIAPSLSDNGQMVAFQSSASNLVNTSVQSINDVYVRNLATSTTQLVSVNDTGTADGDSSSFAPQISGDGNHVLFYSLANDLTTNDNVGTGISDEDVFERNLTTNTTQLVSINYEGTNNGDDTSRLANQTFANFSQQATGQISDNGQYVTFYSIATDLVPNFDQLSGGDPYGYDVYLRDTVGETTTLLSHAVGLATTGGTGESGTAAMTPDGLNIAFQSAFPGAPDNLVSNDTNGQTQLFDADLSPAVATAITATVGTPQSATVNTAFATALQATVTDQNGNPLNGATVTFAAPASGASGTFPGGQTTVMVSTNASGVATAPTFTANATAGAYTVTATVAGVATPASFSLTNTNTSVAVATAITAVSGTGTYAGNATLTATLTTNGTPLAGKSVAFTLDIDGTVTPVGSAMTDTNGVATLSGISLAGFNAGTAAVGASFAGDATHAHSGGSGDLTVNRATPTINWPAPAAILYGTALSGNRLDATASYNGSPVAGTFAYSPASGTLLGAGLQTLSETFTPTDTTDYKSTTTTTTINVLPASLTVTVHAASRSYGQPNPTFRASYSGFASGQGPSVLSGVLTFNTTAMLTSNVGSYPLLASGLSSPNYKISYVPSTVTVNPEAITFAAVNKVKKFKAANPQFTFIETGFVLGQTAKNVFTGAPVLSTTATNNSRPGKYTIVVRTGTLHLLNKNFTFTFVSGVLQVK